MKVNNSLIRVLFILSLIFYSCSDDNGAGPGDTAVPDVSTTLVNNVTRNSAEGGGTVSSDGGATVTARGVCWTTGTTPTIADDKTVDGSGTGTFTSSITGLTAATPYVARAYATNSAGTGYGEYCSFTTESGPDSTGMVTDIDGNVYETVKIGEQWWMSENLKVTHYRNGDTIPHVTDNASWEVLSTGAYCEYGNASGMVITFGRLYNWHAVNDDRNIAPAGWHVPTDDEWKLLEKFLGMSDESADSTSWRGTDQGGQLKEADTGCWHEPNKGATNITGFTAVPGGLRNHVGNYYNIYYFGSYWTSTAGTSIFAMYRGLFCDRATIERSLQHRQSGFSVRCIKD